MASLPSGFIMTLGFYAAILSLILWFVFSKFLKIIVIKTWLHWILLYGFSVAVLYGLALSFVDNWD